jgi:hypothetical protein
MYRLWRLARAWRRHKERYNLARQEKERQQRYQRWLASQALRVSRGLPHADAFESLWRDGVPWEHYFPYGPDKPRHKEDWWSEQPPMPRYDPSDTEECDLCGEICSCLHED